MLRLSCSLSPVPCNLHAWSTTPGVRSAISPMWPSAGAAAAITAMSMGRSFALPVWIRSPASHPAVSSAPLSVVSLWQPCSASGFWCVPRACQANTRPRRRPRRQAPGPCSASHRHRRSHRLPARFRRILQTSARMTTRSRPATRLVRSALTTESRRRRSCSSIHRSTRIISTSVRSSTFRLASCGSRHGFASVRPTGAARW